MPRSNDIRFLKIVICSAIDYADGYDLRDVFTHVQTLFPKTTGESFVIALKDLHRENTLTVNNYFAIIINHQKYDDYVSDYEALLALIENDNLSKGLRTEAIASLLCDFKGEFSLLCVRQICETFERKPVDLSKYSRTIKILKSQVNKFELHLKGNPLGKFGGLSYVPFID